jgi:hypothetical protein
MAVATCIDRHQLSRVGLNPIGGGVDWYDEYYHCAMATEGAEVPKVYHLLLSQRGCARRNI